VEANRSSLYHYLLTGKIFIVTIALPNNFQLCRAFLYYLVVFCLLPYRAVL
jgi:hypothetical protein